MERFRIAVPDSELLDLRNRLRRTRWGGDFGGDDWRYGANGVYLRELVDYWLNHYDWTSTEAAINGFENYRIEISGIQVHSFSLRVRAHGRNLCLGPSGTIESSFVH